jgi:RHS repeat-associated protein
MADRLEQPNGTKGTTGGRPLYGITPITNAKGLAAGNKVRILGTTNWITNVNYYDAKSRPIYSYNRNDYLATTNTVKSKLDFVGKTLETTTTHNRNNTTIISIVDTFTYDHAGRMTTQTQSINGANPPEVIVANTYDELGQLTSKKVGGKTNNGLQKVDYAYNIRGWLKSINDPNNFDQDNDLFSFGLNYNTIANTSLPTYYQNKPLYNGNISGTSWKTSSVIPVLKQYNYTYDALNRFKNANFIEDKINNNNKFNESINSYDRNGNIMNLQRNMQSPTNTNSSTGIDYLTYTYDNGNKLLAVKDYYGLSTTGIEGFKDGNPTGIDYSYDANGNMTNDLNKSIIGQNGTDGITYNHLNLPTHVILSTGTIDYVYDATGVKQRKTVTPGATTDYSGGFQYENNDLKFFSQPEGYVDCNSGTYSYIYQYKDHLGNVRLSYSDSNNNGEIRPPLTYQTVWQDGFESATGWDGTGASWGHPLDAFDTAKKHTGNRSGRIDIHNEDSYRSRSVHSTEWIPIDNTVDTKYRISGWVFIEDKTLYFWAQLELMMKDAGETGYMTLYDHKKEYTKNKWVFVDKIISVPAHIKSLNSRISIDYRYINATTGSIWFDDLKIEKVIENTQNEIVEENNYYPFGLKHKDGNNVVTSTNPGQKYRYNSKEYQDELGLNFYDYGARNYDPAIGRWMNIDPLAEKYPNMSPYCYVANNPINAIDPDGRDIIFLTRNNNGSIKEQFNYRNGNFYHENGKRYNPGKENVSKTMYKVLTAYRAIEKSKDNVLKNQLHTLENSKETHYVEQSPNRENAVTELAESSKSYLGFPSSTQTEYDFDLKYEGEKSDLGVVAHEMRHQFDHDIGNMQDNAKINDANDPAEIRAVYNENRARKTEGKAPQSTYDGKKIDPKKLANPQNNKQSKNEP